MSLFSIFASIIVTYLSNASNEFVSFIGLNGNAYPLVACGYTVSPLPTFFPTKFVADISAFLYERKPP